MMNEDDKVRARPDGPGSREPSPDGLGPSGFDPSRIEGFIKPWRAIIALLIPMPRRLYQRLIAGGRT